MNTEKYLTYDDVAVVPEYSAVKTRKNVNVKSSLYHHKFETPAIPANMKCSIDFKTAEFLDSINCFYIMHRFLDYEEILSWIENKKLNIYSVSIGVNEKDYRFIDEIVKRNLKIDYLTIDIAHAHSIKCINILTYAKKRLNKNVVIIVGNVGTVSACKDLIQEGADVIKVGLSYGQSCSTYTQTGIGTPMFTTVKKICDESTVPIIADGGVRCVGDICKALGAGASMVMVGSMFAQCIDSPADLIEHPISNEKRYKRFYGSASSINKGHDDFVEGKEIMLECNNLTYMDMIKNINDGVKSFLSYIGHFDISNAHLANFIEVSRKV
jgi:GMP reductase